MNWKEINEKYPKAFLEWVNGTIQFNGDEVTSISFDGFLGFLKGYNPSGGVEFACYELDDSDVHNLPYYFDALGIRVDTYTHLKNFICTIDVYPIGEMYYCGREHPDRLTATIAGATKAFEIREAQLNN